MSKSRLKYQHCLIENINTIAVSNAFPNIIQSNYMYVNKIYKISFLQQTMFLAHLTQRVRWAIVTTERPSSVVRPSVNFSHFNQLLWTYLKPLGQFEPSFGGMVLGWSPFRIVSDNPSHQPRWLLLPKIENSAKNHLKIISSETAGPIGPKLWWNGL